MGVSSACSRVGVLWDTRVPRLVMVGIHTRNDIRVYPKFITGKYPGTSTVYPTGTHPWNPRRNIDD